MNVYIAGYKAPGKVQDRAVRLALSIQHAQCVKYSHVEIVKARPQLSADKQTLFQDCIAASKRDGSRVREKTITFRPGGWDFIELKHPRSEHLWQNAIARIGKPYDLKGALLCVTPWARLKPNVDWCSGMIADILGFENPEIYDPHMIMAEVRSFGGEEFSS